MKVITKMLLRILAIYFLVNFFVEGIPQLSGIIYSGHEIKTGVIIGLIIAQLLELLLALLLWFFADNLGNLIIDDSQAVGKIDYQQLHYLAFSLVGIVLLAVSIPDVIQYAIEYFTPPSSVIVNVLPELIGKVVELVIGIFLLLAGEWLVDKIKS